VAILVVVVYRPGSAALSDLFFNEISDLLERSSTQASSLIIAIDLNVHLHVTSDPATDKFLEVLEHYSLIQHVTGSTHRAGHCLDVLITRRELCVRSVDVSPLMFSDHSCIVGRIDLLFPQDHSTVWRECRCWRQFYYDSFCADLCQSEIVRDPSSPPSVAELLDRYDSTLRSLLDVHAPVRTICIKAPWTAPCYDVDCQCEKKETRHIEKLYRRTKAADDEKLWRVQFQHQRQFLQQRLRDDWTSTIDSYRVETVGSNVATHKSELESLSRRRFCCILHVEN
jgi:hypothetical protein